MSSLVGAWLVACWLYMLLGQHIWGVGGVIYGGNERRKRVPLTLKYVDLTSRQYKYGKVWHSMY